ncbi:MAG: glycoside hydrolase family 88 protein [Clostridia bacterium]|nr:glycoside hydrolase family 88 protein [Clostridia bacterium]
MKACRRPGRSSTAEHALPAETEGGPFLCRYSQLFGCPEAMDAFAEQLLLYRESMLIRESQLMSHIYCLRSGKANRIPWSRGNGWVIFSLSELLERLPQNHPRRRELTVFFGELTEGYLKVQDPTGLWHQVLDDPASYLESSATAMMICAFSRGIRNGWYPEEKQERVRKAAEHAWRGLTEVAIDRRGNLYGVCQGSGFSFSRTYYRALGWNFNDTHGIGIVLLAGTELRRMMQEE